MLETILMLVGLVIIGYTFSISSRMFLIYKSEKSKWRWMYGMVSVFVFSVFFLFALILFSFLTNSLMTPTFLNMLNVVIAVFFLAGAGLIWAVMKHNVSLIISHSEKKRKEDTAVRKLEREKEKLRKELERERGSGDRMILKQERKEKKMLKEEISALREELDEQERIDEDKRLEKEIKEKERLREEVKRLKYELSRAEKIGKLSSGKELRVIELEKMIDELEKE